MKDSWMKVHPSTPGLSLPETLSPHSEESGSLPLTGMTIGFQVTRPGRQWVEEGHVRYGALGSSGQHCQAQILLHKPLPPPIPTMSMFLFCNMQNCAVPNACPWTVAEIRSSCQMLSQHAAASFLENVFPWKKCQLSSAV